jgi:threonine/homoserine/homoserine lactone efflux protein
MGPAVGETLAIALAIAICPIPIVAVVLLLTSPSGRTNGPLFVLGWLTGLAVVGTAVLLIAGPTSASESGGPATWVSWAKIALALLLVRMGVRELRGRTSVGHTATPKWMGAIDSATPVRAFGFGALLSGVNPKSLILAVAGAATIPRLGSPVPSRRGHTRSSRWSARSVWRRPSSSRSRWASARPCSWSASSSGCSSTTRSSWRSSAS